jgi:replicative DNA helicase
MIDEEFEVTQTEDILDIKILKGLAADKVNAMTFTYLYDYTLFDKDYQSFARLFLDYIKTFKASPTRNVLLDRHSGNLEQLEVINEIWNSIESLEYDTKEFNYDLAKLKKRYQTDAAETIRVKIANDTSGDPDQFLKKIALDLQKIAQLDLARTHIHKSVAQNIDEFLEKYEARKEAPDQIQEIMTRYSMLDAVTGGLGNAELIMVGGETSAGKSVLLSNLGIQMWLQENTIDTKPENFSKGYNILYFSLEMNYDECYVRFLSRLANVPQRQLGKADLTDDEYQRVLKAKEFIKAYEAAGCYFDIVDVPRNLTIEEVELRYNDALLRYRPDVVIIDYMGLMHSTLFAKEQDWLRLGAIAASLHEFSRAYDCLMITAAQLTDQKRGSSQKNADESLRVGTHRWGRSSLIMHHVNVGIQIETRPNERSYPDMRIHVVKNRKGPLGQGSLIKNFANASLIDVPFDEKEMPGDISSSIPDLIKSIQESKN